MVAEDGDLKGIDLVASSGEACSMCRGGPSTLIRVGPSGPGRGTWVRVCTDCREPWSGEVVEIMSRWVSSHPRTDAAERRLTSRIDEQLAFHRVFEKPARRGVDGVRFAPGRWRFGVQCFLLYCTSEWGSVARVVEWGERHEKKRARRELFTVKRVRTSMERTRGVLEERARSEGMLR